MFNHLFAWIRRNTRKAVALAIGPGLLFLALDAGIAHFVGHEASSPALQRVPVYYGMAAALLLVIAAFPRSRMFFAVVARTAGVVGVAVGLAGTWFHIAALLKDMDGTYDWATLQGSLSTTPPVFAPLAFSGIGALIFVLASPKLLLRYRVGKVGKARTNVLPLNGDDRARRVG
jgi:hypothetical protein